ncbi:DUF5132 domain-containing protein [Methylocystis heyeri]|uniref:DUF5132 domain-containing protein n=1 Tax=Methylocystis heyeri TaxID=391905 RepID=UPI00113632C6|nr:DUF5132 domain-containing protein [Methylocystis heyeri]
MAYDTHSHDDRRHSAEEHDADVAEHDEEDLAAIDSTTLATIATIGVVGVGVVVMEAALLPGVALGVAAVAAPKYFPRLSSALAPIFRSTVRGVYKASQKTREFVAEAQEHVGDIVAEVEAESGRSETSERKA